MDIKKVINNQASELEKNKADEAQAIQSYYNLKNSLNEKYHPLIDEIIEEELKHIKILEQIEKELTGLEAEK